MLVNEDQKVPEDLSVIVPTYNHAPYIKEALDSILAQETEYKIKIYVMDDCSIDGTSEIVRDEYVVRYPEVISHHMPAKNLGNGFKQHYYHKLNLQGRYWCILEGDDYWESKDKVQKQIETMDADEDLIVTAHGIKVLNEKKDQDFFIEEAADGVYCNLFELRQMRHVSTYVHTSTLIWRNIYKARGFYFPPEVDKMDRIGDPMLFNLMTRKGGKIRYLKGLYSVYRIIEKGDWSRLPPEEQQRLNKKLERDLRRETPLLWQLYSLARYKFLPRLKRFNPRMAAYLTDLFVRKVKLGNDKIPKLPT